MNGTRFDMLPPSLWQRIGSELGLSPRELQVAICMLDERGSTGTAKLLKITEHTVHSHRARIYQKLGVRSPAGVVSRLFTAYVSLEGRRLEA